MVVLFRTTISVFRLSEKNVESWQTTGPFWPLITDPFLSSVYRRSDYLDMDEANWRVFVNSRYAPESGNWGTFTKSCHQMFKYPVSYI